MPVNFSAWYLALLTVACHLAILQSLNLRDTEVTDTGVQELAQLKGLQRLNLSRTGVTQAGITALRKVLPEWID